LFSTLRRPDHDIAAEVDFTGRLNQAVDDEAVIGIVRPLEDYAQRATVVPVDINLAGRVPEACG
jgi:hypothetical protein